MEFPRSDYSPSSYTSDFEEPGVKPWQLDQALTPNLAAVQDAIAPLQAFGGGDGPEAYGRAPWETDNNPDVGWRPEARHVIILVADNVPHDLNLDEGLPESEWSAEGTPAPWDTGEELAGTWSIPDTPWTHGADTSIRAVMAQLANDGKPLGMVDFQGTETGYLPYWEYWAGLSGGEALLGGTGELAGKLTTLVETRATAQLPPCPTGESREGNGPCVANPPSPPPPPPPPPATKAGVFVALGDSYSSGQSNPPYLSGTDTRTDECHRSALAYPFDSSLGLGFYAPNFSFHACNGAKISAFFASFEHEPAQLSWLGSTDVLVTLTVGGDNAFFAKVMASCVAGHDCQKQWQARVNHAIAEMGRYASSNQQSLQRLYMMIAKDAPNAKVAVVGYPRFFPSSPPDHCVSELGPTINRARMLWINSEISHMDKTIEDAVAATHRNYSRVLYASGSYDAFAHHELCTASPDMYGVKASIHEKARGESFHPNINGHRALATLVERTAG